MSVTEPYRQLDPARPRGFWEQPWVIAFLVLAMAVPLIGPDVPPLVDLPGHMARYAVQLGRAGDPALQHFFDYDMALIGNLGIDLLIVPVAALFGLELGTKLLIMAIPVLTAAGFLWVAREVHGRIPPSAFLALPFAYGFPFLFGFVNFALSMALAFLAFGLWLQLGRLDRDWLRAAIFVPISVVVWTAHTFGWGTLGVLAFSAELIRHVDQRRAIVAAGFRAAVQCLSLAPPMLLMLLWRTGAQGGGFTGDFFNWHAKWLWIKYALRDRWEWFDLGALALVTLLLLRAAWSPRLQFSRNLLASVIFLSIVFLCLPRIMFGSAYADMRLVPYLFAVAILAVRLKPRAGPRFAAALAGLALLFVGVRLAGLTYSFALHDRRFDAELAALKRVPRGARLVSFVGRPCREGWMQGRTGHLPGLATVRRHAFTNDQWQLPGGALLTVRYAPAGWFMRDPSQIVTPRKCTQESWLSLDDSLKTLPRDAFDYVWLIRPPFHDQRLLVGLQPIWHNGHSVLYRVFDRAPPPIALEETG